MATQAQYKPEGTLSNIANIHSELLFPLLRGSVEIEAHLQTIRRLAALCHLLIHLGNMGCEGEVNSDQDT